MRFLRSLIVSFFIVFFMSYASSMTYAETDESSGNDFWGQANSWFETGKEEYGDITTMNDSATAIINQFKEMVNVLGTTVIVLVTIFLGVKYIYGSFESKAEVKDGLIGLLVACVFFFGWTSIWELLFPRRKLHIYSWY